MSTIGPFPIDIWIEICHNLSVKLLFTLRTASKGLCQTVDTRSVWLCAFNDLLRVKPSVYTTEDIEEMSSSQLREASRRIAHVDWTFSLWEAPYRETTVLECVPSSDFKLDDVTLLPGGERALIPKSDGSLHIYDIAANSLLFSTPEIEDKPVNTCRVRHLYPMSLHTGYVVVFVAMRVKEEGCSSPRFCIYYYTHDEIRHIWTEKEYLGEGYDDSHAICHQKDALVFTQLCRMSDNNSEATPANWRVRTCTVNKNGCNNQENFSFYLEGKPDRVSRPTLLSPRYFAYEYKDELLLVDLYHARNQSQGQPHPILSPIWQYPKEPERTYLWTTANAVRSTKGGEPYIRGFCISGGMSPGYIRMLELPAISDLKDPTLDIRVVKFPYIDSRSLLFDTPSVTFTQGILHQRYDHQGGPYGQSYCDYHVACFSIAHPIGESGPLPGMMRLGRKTCQPDVRGGHAHKLQGLFRNQRLGSVSYDEASGRYLQFKDEKSWPRIVLYTPENRAPWKYW